MHRSSCQCHSHNGFQLRPSDEGLAQRKDVRYGVDTMDMFEYLDNTDSVSANEEPPIFDDYLLEEQHQRFHNGS